MGIGAALMADGYRFAAPNQFRAASAKSLPTAKRMLAWTTVARAVPSIHRLNGITIRDFYSFAKDGLREWRFLTAPDLIIARDI